MKQLLLILSLTFSYAAQSASGVGNDWKFLNDKQVSPGTKFEETVVGGLSALFVHNGKYFALSDDRGKVNEPRIYQYSITAELSKHKQRGFSQNQLRAEPEKVIFLKDSQGAALVKMSIDPEGLVVLKDGSFLVTSEGNVNGKPRLGPQLFHFGKDGKLIREISLPEYYSPEKTGQAKKGIRNNLGPEGLSLSPSGKYLFMAMENVLVQDGEETSYEKTGMARVLRFLVENDTQITLDSEKLYPMSQVTHPNVKAILLGTGISEIKALSDDKILFLERSATQTESTVINEIKLFIANYSTGDEVKGQASILNKNLKPITKTLAYDLNNCVDQFVGPKMLDNMEALEFGPELNGKKTLLVLSDDNFSPLQRSLWIWLQMPESL